MNIEVAKEIYELRYQKEMSFDDFTQVLEQGLKLLNENPCVDKVFMSRFYKVDDLKCVNIALEYNEELMVKLLML